MSDKPTNGAPIWHDLTVQNAAEVRDFYQGVIGWGSEGLDMDGYDDYVMTAPGTGSPVGGVCHAKGVNAALPPVWLIYFAVEDVAAAAERCIELGGRVLHASEPGSNQGFAVIQDPAGAVCAISAMPPEA